MDGLTSLACSMIQFLKKRWVYHCLFWVGSYLLLAGFDFINGNSDSFFSALKEILLILSPIPLLIVTYLGLFAKEKFFDHSQYLIYFMAFVVIVAIGVSIESALSNVGIGTQNHFSQNVINFTFLQLMAVGIQYFKRGIVNQYQLQELREKTMMTELNALKAQINPHFLFNTLNNIYGMNQINSEKGSEMILELSDVMRYHLEFSKEGEVRIEDEIQLLQSYIKLERLRLRDTCDVQIDIEEVDKGLMISPLLFLPFVENAFKHGTHPTKACFVHIQLKTISDKLHFSVKNSMFENRKVVKTNIGLQNTKRRLELLFPNRHQLDIMKNEGHHLVELIIDL